MADYAGLQTEIALPAYSSMTDTQIAASLNGKTINTLPVPLTIQGADLFNAILRTEFDALSTTLQTAVRDVFSLSGNIDISASTNARVILQNAFAVGTITRANIAAIVTVKVSRASQLGFNQVSVGDIGVARSGVYSTP